MRMRMTVIVAGLIVLLIILIVIVVAIVTRLLTIGRRGLDAIEQIRRLRQALIFARLGGGSGLRTRLARL